MLVGDHNRRLSSLYCRAITYTQFITALLVLLSPPRHRQMYIITPLDKIQFTININFIFLINLFVHCPQTKMSYLVKLIIFLVVLKVLFPRRLLLTEGNMCIVFIHDMTPQISKHFDIYGILNMNSLW